MPPAASQFNTTEREPFRWLFTAEFADGTVIRQDQEDKSTTRTDGSGSTFTDVLARESELVAFHLLHVATNDVATVDLRTGAFVVNGTPFHAHNQYFEPSKYPLKLVYFRETRMQTETHGEVQPDGSIRREDGLNPRHFVNRYFIGWSTEVHGKTKQVTIAVG